MNSSCPICNAPYMMRRQQNIRSNDFKLFKFKYYKCYACKNYFMDKEEKINPEIFSNNFTIDNFLTDREKFVLNKRLNEKLTLAKIGDLLDVQSERIRQIEAHGLEKLRFIRYVFPNISTQEFDWNNKQEVLNEKEKKLLDNTI